MALPFTTQPQQNQPRRHIGVLVPQAETDPEQQAWIAAFITRLHDLGWSQGANVQIDFRWAGGDIARMAPLAKELVDKKPDVILAATNTATVVMRQYTLTVPIIFTQVPDPVADGLVTNLAHPEGNITGFTVSEFAIGGKWLEALKEFVPGLTRVAVLFDPASTPWPAYVRAIEAAARRLTVELTPFPVQSDAEIESAFSKFTSKPNGAVIGLPTGSVVLRRKKIISLAASHQLPAIYPYRLFTVEGGLMSYGSDLTDEYRSAADYVDRILKGEKLANLPVQAPTRYELVINLKTAKALGLSIPQTLLGRADEVIE